jgi:coenzyme F420-reducing hydrogenase beta subunit
VKNVTIVDKCCGCGACAEVCPIKCIEMHPSEEGFFVPKIGEQCVNCGKCLETCPVYLPLLGEKYKKAYAGYAKEYDVRINSSSGGIFSKLAEVFLENGGSVIGAAFDSEMDLRHIEVREKSEIKKIRGSKYLQSDITTIFKKVKDNIENAKSTMVVGTPCQIAALKKYIDDDTSYLFTVDLVCHGVPSPGMFKGYLNVLEKKFHGKICGYNFREKKGDGISYSTNIELISKRGQKKNIKIDGNEDPYIMNFLTNRLQRKSCFSCPYTKIERVGDITLADYWGYEEAHPELKKVQGVSLILVNTEKGIKYLQMVKNLSLVETEEEKFSKKNHHLYESPKYTRDRDELYRNYAKRGFDLRFYKKNFLPHNYKIFLLKRRVKKLIQGGE